jgi:hypothetical protein
MVTLCRLGNIFGWLAIVYGALSAGASLPVLYLLAGGVLRPASRIHG